MIISATTERAVAGNGNEKENEGEKGEKKKGEKERKGEEADVAEG